MEEDGEGSPSRRNGSDSLIFPSSYPQLLSLAEPGERSLQPFGLGSFLRMISTRFLDRLGLRFLDKGRIGEAPLERLGFLLRGMKGLCQPSPFGCDVDHAFKRDH